MVTIELPPNFDEAPAPIPPTRPGRPPLSPQRTYRRDKVLHQLVHPLPIGESATLLEDQSRDIHKAFKPRNGWQDWLTDTIATILLRINRSGRIERKLRDLASYRAFDFWEEDQQLAVETVALKLAKEPAKVVAQLRATPTGIDWLLTRWRLLAQVEPQSWTDAQRELAVRLVGGDEGLNPAAPGFVAGRIADLESYRENVANADAIIRGLVEADLHDDGVPGLAQLRRYVRALHRQLKWYVDQFHVDHADRWDDPWRRPASEGPPREEWRPRNHNHFEGKVEPTYTVVPDPVPEAEAAPGDDATNPLSPSADQKIAETKPLSAKSDTKNDETKPLGVRSDTKNDETKPLGTQSDTNNGETKPFAAVQPTRTTTDLTIAPAGFVPDDSTEEGQHLSRALQAGKSARRRAKLALAELT